MRIQYLDMDAPHPTAFNTIKIDPTDSQLLTHERYENKQAGARLLASMLSIHKGAYFGLAGMILLMLSSLALPLFVITGWMMYLDRRQAGRPAGDLMVVQNGCPAPGCPCGSNSLGLVSSRSLTASKKQKSPTRGPFCFWRKR